MIYLALDVKEKNSKQSSNLKLNNKEFIIGKNLPCLQFYAL